MSRLLRVDPAHRFRDLLGTKAKTVAGPLTRKLMPGVYVDALGLYCSEWGGNKKVPQNDRYDEHSMSLTAAIEDYQRAVWN